MQLYSCNFVCTVQDTKIIFFMGNYLAGELCYNIIVHWCIIMQQPANFPFEFWIICWFLHHIYISSLTMNYYVVAQLSSQIVDVVHKEYYVYISDSKHLPIVLAEQAVHVCIACSLISKASSEQFFRLHHNDHAWGVSLCTALIKSSCLMHIVTSTT